MGGAWARVVAGVCVGPLQQEGLESELRRNCLSFMLRHSYTLSGERAACPPALGAALPDALCCTLLRSASCVISGSLSAPTMKWT